MSGTFALSVGNVRVDVNVPSQIALLGEVRRKMREGQAFSVATLNLDHTVKLKECDVFRDAYARQDFVVADGHPIVWLSRLAHKPVSLVAGSDLIEPMARLAAQERIPVALFGTTEETLLRAADALRSMDIDLDIVATLAPGLNFDPDGEEAGRMIEALRTSGARLTFLALGAPRQEVFAIRCRDSIPGMGLVSIGAGLDFLASSQLRAPVWMRRMALEWLWRIMSDPRRLALRYVRCALALPGLTLGVLTDRRTAVADAVEPGKVVKFRYPDRVRTQAHASDGMRTQPVVRGDATSDVHRGG